MERESRIARWLSRRSPRARWQGAALLAGGRGRSRTAAADAEAVRIREGLLLAAAGAGFPLAPAAHPAGYGCSCVRIGCPTPGRHPVSFAWQTQATTDATQVERWARSQPQANFVTPTGRRHDVLDVPAEAGRTALKRLEAEGVTLGPVALSGDDRMLFFTATRTPDDEEEWWPCELDCHPETLDAHPGLRWHCRGSYVLVPPAVLPGAGERAAVRWLRAPGVGEQPDGGRVLLPEPLTLLEALTDACAEHLAGLDEDEPASWPVH